MENIKKTAKKPAVKSNSKIVAGGKKAKFSKPVLALMVATGVLVLTAVGTFGYTKLKENDLKAQAAGMRELQGMPGVYGCRVNGRSGPEAIKIIVNANKIWGYKSMQINAYNKNGTKLGGALGGEWWGRLNGLTYNPRYWNPDATHFQVDIRYMTNEYVGYSNKDLVAGPRKVIAGLQSC